jgi:hypothetical protein
MTFNYRINFLLIWVHGKLFLRKLGREIAFDIFTTKWVSRVNQYDRIDDLISCDLGGDERTIGRQFLIDEFYLPTICERFDPLFVWHFRASSVNVGALARSRLPGSMESRKQMQSSNDRNCRAILDENPPFTRNQRCDVFSASQLLNEMRVKIGALLVHSTHKHEFFFFTGVEKLDAKAFTMSRCFVPPSGVLFKYVQDRF